MTWLMMTFRRLFSEVFFRANNFISHGVSFRMLPYPMGCGTYLQTSGRVVFWGDGVSLSVN